MTKLTNKEAASEHKKDGLRLTTTRSKSIKKSIQQPSFDDMFGSPSALETDGKPGSTTRLTWQAHVGQALETQPTMLKELIVDEHIPAMLDTFWLICQRELTQAERDKPVKNLSGEETTFTPTTHQFNDTMHASYECFNGSEMKTLPEESREKDEAERLRRANQEIAAGQLEINNDLRHLRKQISNLMMIITGSCLIQRRTRTLSARLTGGETTFVLDDEGIVHEIVRSTLSQFEEDDADYLGIVNANELAQEFVADMNLNEADIRSKLENETGKATLKYIKSISNKWAKLLLLITVEVF